MPRQQEPANKGASAVALRALEQNFGGKKFFDSAEYFMKKSQAQIPAQAEEQRLRPVYIQPQARNGSQ